MYVRGGVGAACLIILCFIGLKKSLNFIYEKEGFVINQEAALSWSHFFMMGLNEERNGVYAGGDVSFSNSIRNAKERRNQNLIVSAERLKQLGFTGYLKHVKKKLLVTYNDGSYAWSEEGGFYSLLYENPNQIVSPFLRSIYYADGKWYKHFLTAAQTSWLMLLTLDFFAVFYPVSKEKKKYLAILMLSLLGLMLYEILFEARARYLYIYLPINCILAAFGIRVFYHWMILVWKQIKNTSMLYQMKE